MQVTLQILEFSQHRMKSVRQYEATAHLISPVEWHGPPPPMATFTLTDTAVLVQQPARMTAVHYVPHVDLIAICNRCTSSLPSAAY
eukprot:1160513-Pelagomonas_calceolata.AAC.13